MAKKATKRAPRSVETRLREAVSNVKALSPKPLQGAMSAVDMARTLNEWMRRYIETPEAYEAEFQTVSEFVKQEQGGREPSYGDVCATYQFKLLEEMNAKAAA